MVNIHNFLPNYPEDQLIESTEVVWALLLSRRLSSFQGFFATEMKNNPSIQQRITFNTAAGQDYARGLLFRVIEEVGEALEANSRDHRYEELIDAVNYLFAVVLMDHKMYTPEELTRILRNTTLYGPAPVPASLYPEGGFPVELHSTPLIGWTPQLTTAILGEVAYFCSTYIGNSLRIRSWTAAPQDIYFAGRPMLTVTLTQVLSRILQFFPDFTTFYRYYVAKDDVLKFRLRSKY